MGIDDQIACLAAEVKRRKRVFPALIEKGRMASDTSALEIAKMQAALETLTQLRGLVRKA